MAPVGALWGHWGGLVDLEALGGLHHPEERWGVVPAAGQAAEEVSSVLARGKQAASTIRASRKSAVHRITGALSPLRSSRSTCLEATTTSGIKIPMAVSNGVKILMVDI